MTRQQLLEKFHDRSRFSQRDIIVVDDTQQQQQHTTTASSTKPSVAAAFPPKVWQMLGCKNVDVSSLADIPPRSSSRALRPVVLPQLLVVILWVLLLLSGGLISSVEAWKSNTTTTTNSYSPTQTESFTDSDAAKLTETMTETGSATETNTLTLGSDSFTSEHTATETGTLTFTGSMSPTLSLVSTGSVSDTLTVTESASDEHTMTLGTLTDSLTLTDSTSLTLTVSLSESAGARGGRGGSPTLSPSSTLTISETLSATLTESETMSTTYSADTDTPVITASATPSLVDTFTATATFTGSLDVSVSGLTASPSSTGTFSDEVTMTMSLSHSHSMSDSIINSPTDTLVETHSDSLVATATLSFSMTDTLEMTLSHSETQSLTETASETLVATDSASDSFSPTSETTMTASGTTTLELTFSDSPSFTASPSFASFSATSEPTSSKSFSASTTWTQRETVSTTGSPTETLVESPTDSLPRTFTASASQTLTATLTASASESVTGTLSESVSESGRTISGSLVVTETLSSSFTATTSETETLTHPQTITSSPVVTLSGTQTIMGSASQSVTLTYSESPTETKAISVTPTITASDVLTHTQTAALTTSPSLPMTQSAWQTWTLNGTSTSATVSVSAGNAGTSTHTTTNSLALTMTAELVPTTTATATLSFSPSPTETLLATSSLSISLSLLETATESLHPTETGTSTVTVTDSDGRLTGSETITSSDSGSKSHDVTVTEGSETLSATNTLVDTPTLSGTDSAGTTTVSHNPSDSITVSSSDSATKTGSESVSVSSSSTAGLTATAAETETHALTLTSSESESRSPSMSVSALMTQTPDITLSPTGSISITTTGSMSHTTTMTLTESSSETMSTSETVTVTKSMSPSRSAGLLVATFTASPSISESMTFGSVSESEDRTASVTATATESLSESETLTESPSSSLPASSSVTHSIVLTLSSSFSSSQSLSPSLTLAVTESQSHTFSMTPTITHAVTLSESETHTGSEEVTLTHEISASGTTTDTLTDSQTLSDSESEPVTLTMAISATPSSPITLSEMPTATPDPTHTKRLSSSVTTTETEPTHSLVITGTATPSFTRSPSPSQSPTVTMSMSLSETHQLTLTMATMSISTTTSVSSSFSVSFTYSPSFLLGTFSLSNERTMSETPSGSVTMTDSISKTTTFSRSMSEDDTITEGLSDTKTITTSQTMSESPSGFSPTSDKTMTVTETHELTLTESGQTITVSYHPDSNTRTASLSFTTTHSATFSVMETASENTPSITETIPATPSHELSHTITVTKTLTQMVTLTSTLDVTESLAKSLSPTLTMTDAPVPTKTKSMSPSETFAETISGSGSRTLTMSESFSVTSSLVESPSVSLSPTLTITHEESMTAARLSTTSTMTLTGDRTATWRSSTFTGSESVSERTLTLPVSLSDTITDSVSETFSMSPSITPPPTPTRTHSPSLEITETDSASESGTLSASDSVLISATNTIAETPTTTLSATTSLVPTLTGTESTTVTMSMSESTTLSPTGSETVSVGTITGSFTSDKTMSATPTPPPTPSTTLALSTSNSVPITETHTFTTDMTMTESLSTTETASETGETRSLPLTDTETISGSLSVSFSGTKSINSLTQNARYVTRPQSHTNTFPVTKPITVIFRSVPLHVGEDKAGVVPSGEACYNATTDTISPNMTMMQYEGRISQASPTYQHNWTLTINDPGYYTICYFNVAEKRWYNIDKPSNLTFIPLLTGVQGTTELVIGDPFGVFAMQVGIRGYNETADELMLVRYPKDCNEPVPRTRLSWSGYYNPLDHFALVNDSSSITHSGHFTLCYKGFPHLVTTPYVPASTSFLTIRGFASSSETVQGGPLRVRRDTIQRVIGRGLSVRDHFFITNDTNKKCDSWSMEDGTRIVTWGQHVRNPSSFAASDGLTSLDVHFELHAPGFNYLCYRSNSSDYKFTQGMRLWVEPIRAFNFAPNNTDFVWAASSDVILTFTGDGIDNTFDVVELHFGSDTCSSQVAVFSMSGYTNESIVPDENATMVEPELNQYKGRPTIPGVYSVCYRSNVSTFDHLGHITVKRMFYNNQSGSQYESVFLNGVNLGNDVPIHPNTFGLHPLFDVAYAVRFNQSGPSCFQEVPKLGAVLPLRRLDNGTLVFNATARGYWVVCYVTNTGAVLMSDNFAVFPEAPSAFADTTIPLSIATKVSFSGGADMDLFAQDKDVISICGGSKAGTITPVDVRAADITIEELGNYSLCFTSGVISPANKVPFSAKIPGTLEVSPIVTSAVPTPAFVPIEHSVNVNLTGNGLSDNDVMYLCNSTNTSSPPTEVVNTTTVTLYRRTKLEWYIEFKTAGSFHLCYSYAANPSFPAGPLNSVVNVDPSVLSFHTPDGQTSEIEADKSQQIVITGLEVDKVTRLFTRTNATECNADRSPFDVEFTQVDGPTYEINVGTRGEFIVCFAGPSGHVYRVPGNKLKVSPRVDGFTASQDGVSGTNLSTTVFFDGYPIDVVVEGGALEYNLDTFYAVTGSSCAVTNPNRLTTLNPPLVPVPKLSMSFVPPGSGEYRICHQLNGGDAFIIPSLVISVANSLIYSGTQLQVRGPSARPNILYKFQFAADAASVATATGWTPFQKATSVPNITVPYVAMGSSIFRCDILSNNGQTIRTLYLPHTEAGPDPATFCGNFPQSFSDFINFDVSDTTLQFATATIALHNYVTRNCFAVLAATPDRDASSLLNALMTLIASDETLVKDPLFTFTATSKIISTTNQPVAQTTKEAEAMLDGSAATLQRPDTEITRELLESHMTMANGVATVASANLNSADAAEAQKLGLKVIDRLNDIGRRFCSSTDGSLSADQQYNSTLQDITITAKKAKIDDTYAETLDCGFGIQVSPLFQTTINGNKCIQGIGVRGNFLPQRPGVTPTPVRRQGFSVQAEEDTATTTNVAPTVPEKLPDFNFPVFVFSLPSSSAGSNPLNELNTVTFKYQFPPVTRAADDTGTGVTVNAELYRFVPDGGASGSGEWQTAPSARTTADEPTSIITVEYNASTALRTSPSNYVVLSGRYTITPNIDEKKTRDTDYFLAIFVGGLVALHLLLCGAARVADIIRDSRKTPDTAEAGKAPTNITFHRVLNVGTRKPHHPISTWIRVTTLFTFVFSAAFFSILVAEDAPVVHEEYMNAPYGLVVAIISTPFAAVVRFTSQKMLRDYASGVAAAAAVVTIGIAVPVANTFIAAYIAGGVGIVAFFLAALYFRSRWSVTLQPSQGPFSTVFGLCAHLVMELLFISFGLYQALYVGTRIITQDAWHYWMIFGWALVLDALILEPLKNRVVLFLHAKLKEFDKGRDAKKAQKAAALPPPTSNRLKALPYEMSSQSDVEEYHLDDEDGDMAFVEIEEDFTDKDDFDDLEDSMYSDDDRGLPVKYGKRRSRDALSEASTLGGDSELLSVATTQGVGADSDFTSISVGDVGTEDDDDIFVDVEENGSTFGELDAPLNDPFRSPSRATARSDTIDSRYDDGEPSAFGPDPWNNYVRHGNLEDLLNAPSQRQYQQRDAQSVTSFANNPVHNTFNESQL